MGSEFQPMPSAQYYELYSPVKIEIFVMSLTKVSELGRTSSG